MARLTDDEIAARLGTLTGWTRQGDAIRKEYTFRDFPEAVLFVSALIEGAEAADHHPDIEIHYRRVVLSYRTHSEGGITEKDFEGASMADEVAPRVPQMSEFSGGE
jgi:4a-hydroxytetrahydrobiopterin dehydratase